jgi:hypothetical protein
MPAALLPPAAAAPYTHSRRAPSPHRQPRPPAQPGRKVRPTASSELDPAAGRELGWARGPPGRELRPAVVRELGSVTGCKLEPPTARSGRRDVSSAHLSTAS